MSGYDPEAFEQRIPQGAAEAEGHFMRAIRALAAGVCECGAPIPTSIGRCGACGGIIPPVAPTGHQPDPTPTPAERWRNLRALVDKFNERGRVSRVLLNPGGASAWTEAAADLLEALYGPGAVPKAPTVTPSAACPDCGHLLNRHSMPVELADQIRGGSMPEAVNTCPLCNCRNMNIPLPGRQLPRTCAEAGDRCRHECTIDTRTGLIRDPDCFRNGI